MTTEQLGVPAFDKEDDMNDSMSRDLDDVYPIATVKKPEQHNSPNIKAAAMLLRMGTFSSSSPNRRLNHMVTKEAKLIDKIRKIKDKN